MKLSTLMEKYNPVYKETWDEVLDSFFGDYVEARIVEALREDLRKNGKFRDPVILSNYRSDEKQFVLDGTHRIVAAFLEGVDEVEVTYRVEILPEELDAAAEDWSGPYEAVITRFTCHGDVDEIERDGDLFHYLRSLKINDEAWVTASSMFSKKGDEPATTVFEVLWDLDPDALTPSVIEGINYKVHNVVGAFSMLMDVDTVTEVLD